MEDFIMSTQNASLVYQDPGLKEIAHLWGDFLEKLTFREKFWILREISEWSLSCDSLDESEWYAFPEFLKEWEQAEDSDGRDLMYHPACNWKHPREAMGLSRAISFQIQEDLYAMEEEEKEEEE
jgi:hypothetical protein